MTEKVVTSPSQSGTHLRTGSPSCRTSVIAGGLRFRPSCPRAAGPYPHARPLRARSARECAAGPSRSCRPNCRSGRANISIRWPPRWPIRGRGRPVPGEHRPYADLLSDEDVDDLRLLVVGRDPLLLAADQVGDRLSGLHVLPRLEGTAPHVTVVGGREHGVGEVQPCKVQIGLAAQDGRFGPGAAAAGLGILRTGRRRWLTSAS